LPVKCHRSEPLAAFLLYFPYFLYILYFSPSGNGDFCKYAATPITELITAAARPMRSVEPIPACKLKKLRIDTDGGKSCKNSARGTADPSGKQTFLPNFKAFYRCVHDVNPLAHSHDAALDFDLR
jgi:hypothetical protein